MPVVVAEVLPRFLTRIAVFNILVVQVLMKIPVGNPQVFVKLVFILQLLQI
jgi:hypothetical protein